MDESMEFWENSDLVLVKGKKYRMKLGIRTF